MINLKQAGWIGKKLTLNLRVLNSHCSCSYTFSVKFFIRTRNLLFKIKHNFLTDKTFSKFELVLVFIFISYLEFFPNFDLSKYTVNSGHILAT